MISFGSKVSPRLLLRGHFQFSGRNELSDRPCGPVDALGDVSPGRSFWPVLMESKHRMSRSILAEEFERSVTARLRSDVQIGMLLSGGIDSS